MCDESGESSDGEEPKSSEEKEKQILAASKQSYWRVHCS